MVKINGQVGTVLAEFEGGVTLYKIPRSQYSEVPYLTADTRDVPIEMLIPSGWYRVGEWIAGKPESDGIAPVGKIRRYFSDGSFELESGEFIPVGQAAHELGHYETSAVKPRMTLYTNDQYEDEPEHYQSQPLTRKVPRQDSAEHAGYFVRGP